MERVSLLDPFTRPQQEILAKVRGVSVKEIFKEIHKGTIEVLITEEGIKIPITYKFEE